MPAVGADGNPVVIPCRLHRYVPLPYVFHHVFRTSLNGRTNAIAHAAGEALVLDAATLGVAGARPSMACSTASATTSAVGM